LNRNVSGVSASPAPRTAETAPLLRVVTADGAVTIPSVVRERSSERALAEYSEGLRTRLDAALGDTDYAERAIAALAGRDERDTATRKPKLRLVPPPGPVEPATPCPSWCDVEHEDADDRFHYGEMRRFAGFFACLDIDDHDTLTLEVSADRPERANLDLPEVDELIAGLTRARAELADALRARRLVVLAGGAA
jgi:hypothetical protein